VTLALSSFTYSLVELPLTSMLSSRRRQMVTAQACR
jgi:hypothetical protein